MKIVHINTFSHLGGASIAANRLNQLLCNEGIDSKVLVASTNKNISSEYEKVKVNKLNYFLNNLGNKLIGKTLNTNQNLPFSNFDKLNTLCNNNLINESDIIHIHWVQSGFLNFQSILKLYSNKKIFWTFHDCFPFTGGCHKNMDCTNFENTCENCPQSKIDFFAKRNRKEKKEFWSKTQDIKIITPSLWMKKMAEKSGMFQHQTIDYIPNPLNTKIFKIQTRDKLRAKYGFRPEDILLLWGAMPSKTNYHKGLHLMKDIKNKIKSTNVKFLFWANHSSTNDNEYFLPYTINENIIAEYYAIADLYIHTALDDNLPNTVIESLACGTPVVAFNIGGLPEMINDGECGFLIEKGRVDKITEAINQFINSNQKQEFRTKARAKIMNAYHPTTLLKQFINLYQKA